MNNKRITILGSTGSIGQSTLKVLATQPDYEVFALTANGNVDLLLAQCQQFKPEFAVLGAAALAQDLAAKLQTLGLATQVLSGPAALIQVAADPAVTHVMAAIVGGAGLAPSFAAAESGKVILLANKEALVMAGAIFMDAVARSNATLLPVDSEHNAIFQCLGQSSHVGKGVQRILLTGSGGPFLDTPLAALDHVTPDDACRHPNWDMGRKISVDSATMMNKGLELIEACWLFDVPPEKIEFVIHPQSIVHSMVEFVDGSVVAQLGQPDMRTPIAHVLAFPERTDAGVAALDFSKLSALEFRAPELSRFPVLSMARRVASGPKSLAIIFNAANEVAVEAFLAERLSFLNISVVIKAALDAAETQELHSLDDVLAYDATARTLTRRILSSL